MDGHIQRREYEYTPGVFIENPSISRPIPLRFGLIDESLDRWVHLRNHLNELNAKAKPGESYKLVFFCRHGQSYHNVGKEKYGLQEWRSSWARLNGDDEIIWGPDSDITSIGVDQALHIRAEWEKEHKLGLPPPEKIYTSPLTRALRTCSIAFDQLIRGKEKVPVLVVENCREENGLYTYDKRRSLTYIKAEFPVFHVEEGFTEEDELWTSGARETKEAMAARARCVLDMIFDEKPAVTYVCCTIHGGLINSVLSVLGRPKRVIPTGGVCPVVIRGYQAPR